MRISDWSSDVCSSDLEAEQQPEAAVTWTTSKADEATEADETTGAAEQKEANEQPEAVNNEIVEQENTDNVVEMEPVSIVAAIEKLGRATCRARVCQSV